MPAEPSARFAPTRAGIALALIGCILLTLLGRVYWLQTRERERILDKAQRQSHTTERLTARRGSIFDATGQLLAGTIQTQTLFVDPKEMIEAYDGKPGGQVQLEADLAPLAKLLDKDTFVLLQQIGEKYPGRYVEIAYELDDQTLAAIRKMNLPGVGTVPANQRVYPMGGLAAHILGGVGRDGKGLEGLELTCQKTLAGVDGTKRSLKDSRRRAIATTADDYTPVQHGQHLVLNIDANIQLIVEQELAATCKQYGAPAGEAIVMDPATGAVLALANYPSFTPQFIQESKPAQRTNRALVSPYEPGSTIKPFIVSHAVDHKTAKLTDVYQLDGPKWKTAYGRTITDVHGYDKLALWDVLVKSSNIGMSQLAVEMGNPELHSALQRFGYGRQTGIDLPGEETGIVRPLRRWGKTSTESIAQGYELLVTPLQMARAMCTIANGGMLVTPTVIRGTLQDDGTIAALTTQRPMAMKVMEPQTAAGVRRVLADVIVRGTGSKARSEIYNVFGKTGTAHRAVNGSYNQSNYTASFVGGAPYESPRLVIAFVVHDPDRKKAHYGGIVAAPAATRVLDRALSYLHVAPSPQLELPSPQVQSVLYAFDPKAYEKKSVMAKTE